MWEGIKCHTLPVTRLILQHLMVLHSTAQHTGLALGVGEEACVAEWSVGDKQDNDDRALRKIKFSAMVS